VALALYRKYRPQTFGQVIGQEHVTEPLMAALRSGRLNHAYLFSGPRGCGKTSSARILARSLNCAKGPTPEPCGACDSCVALAPGGPGSVDVIEIDAASHGGVDDARDLREKAFFAPVASRYKVYVIDEAHMVTQQGFNAMLKLVEEPPEFVVFVFATTEPEKVLPTIRSRTHHYPFRLIPPGVLRPYLEQLCQQERVPVEPAVFPLVVRAGGGSARDSLSVLDQLIAGAGEQGVTYARAVALLGVTDVALIDEMVDALSAGDGAAAFATIDRVADAGHDPRRFATDLLERLRDLIVLQRVSDATGSGIIDAPTDQIERMAGQAARMGPATLSRLADIVHNGLTEMRGTTAPRLLLELITARMLLPGADDSTSAVLHRLERMERRLGAAEPETAPSEQPVRPTADEQPVRAAVARAEPDSRPRPATPPPAAPPARAAEPQPQRPATPPPSTVEHPVGGTPDVTMVRGVWDEVLTLVKRRSSRVHAFVREGSVRDVQADEVVLLFRTSFHAERSEENSGLIVEALHEVLGGAWRVRVELAGDDRASSRPSVPTRTGAEGPASHASAGEWPETARPGGLAKDPGAPPAQTRSVPARESRTSTRSGGGAGARPAPRSAPQKATRPAPAFDPGDEPLDDASPAVRESSEEQALRAVTGEFTIERLGDTGPQS
jgi:DNA polymerase-3 subunit gamma/tau